YTYDDFGQLTGVLYPTSHTASVSYQWATGTRPQNALFFKLATSPGLPTGKEYYDAFGRVIKTETTGFDGVNICTNTTYNHKGQIEETSLPYKSGSQAYKSDITYDAFGRLATQSSATGIVTFTSNGKTFQTATGTGQTSSKVMDSQGHVLSVTDEGGTITNVYKSIGSPYQINTHGTTWTISYDALGRQISLSDPDAGTTQYRYNKYNELTSQTNARGFKDSLTYDVLGRVTSRIGGDGTTTYVYDPANNPGLLNNIAYPGGNETYTYDTYGRLTNVQQTVNDGSASTYSTGYGYDNQNRITTVTYPSSFAVTNVFNTNGYLSEVKRSDNNATIGKQIK
ncbi:MAG: RHS repeat protein, partial [Chloroflexia bacterium]|nr:RHS repeat protein [Chloroflexia bacterium]